MGVISYGGVPLNKFNLIEIVEVKDYTATHSAAAADLYFVIITQYLTLMPHASYIYFA